MPKTKISEFSSTPASNTDIDSINIAEGCAPSGINDAIRELMAQLKDFQTGAVGDSFNGPVGTTTAAAGAFTTLAASSTVTLSGGTANGVAYLNGSKVVTSGSALTFNGTNLATTASNLDLNPASTVPNISLREGNTYRAYLEGNSSGLVFGIGASATEQMRLTSTGLGIGTSSPAQKLDVRAAAGGIYLSSTTGTNQVALQTNNSGGDFYFGIDNSAGNNFNTGTAYAGVLWRSGANPICFVNNNTERMRLDSSGNLGLGVTPSAWASGEKAIQFAATGNIAFNGTAGRIVTNAYNDGSFKYVGTGQSAIYAQDGGRHIWYNAPSGTAGNAITFTQAMTLDASGNLGVGTTSPDIFGRFYTRSVGFSSSGTTALQVNGSTYGTVDVGAGGTRTGNFVGSSTEVQLGTVTSIPLLLVTNGSERARIDSSGAIVFGKTAVDDTTAGIAFRVGNYASMVRSNGAPLYLNRLTSDGAILEFARSNTLVGTVSVTTTATAYNTSSDYRLKNSIAPMTGALAKVALLKPCTYKWNADGSDGEGFIAHELAEVVPQAVTGEKDAVDEEGNPKYQGIDTSFLVATLTAALQELNAKFDAYVASHP